MESHFFKARIPSSLNAGDLEDIAGIEMTPDRSCRVTDANWYERMRLGSQPPTGGDNLTG